MVVDTERRSAGQRDLGAKRKNAPLHIYMKGVRKFSLAESAVVQWVVMLLAVFEAENGDERSKKS